MSPFLVTGQVYICFINRMYKKIKIKITLLRIQYFIPVFHIDQNYNIYNFNAYNIYIRMKKIKFNQIKN